MARSTECDVFAAAMALPSPIPMQHGNMQHGNMQVAILCASTSLLCPWLVGPIQQLTPSELLCASVAADNSVTTSSGTSCVHAVHYGAFRRTIGANGRC